jgi:hypothetical protein
MKKYLNYKNLSIILILGLIGNNISLQIKMEEAISAADDASYYARKAYNEAEDAASDASDAADYAREASENAENAYYSAEEAVNKSFGSQCWSCP